MSIELTMKRGEEAVAATIDVRDDVTLTEAYDAAAAGLHPMTVRAGAYLGRVLDNLKPVGEVSAPQQAPAPVIDWDSAPEGFPVWIEDLVPFGESTSCWAMDAGSHYLGVNGSKWDKPAGIDFSAHYPTPQSILPLSDQLREKVRAKTRVLAVEGSPAMSAALVAQLRETMEGQRSTSVVLMNPSPVDFQASIKCFDASLVEAVDWSVAPEGATHRASWSTLWYKFDFEADTAFLFGKLSQKWVDVSPARPYLEDGSISDMIARPAPAQKWSLHGKNGTWDYDTLAELIIDCYGHDGDGDGHPASGTPGLYEGDTIYRATPHFDDPVDFLPDASDVVDHMADRASDSDAGEWADRYPDLSADAKEALGKALEPLKAWARMHCQPDFFTVKDITSYILTVEDVRAAKAQERAQ